MELESILKSRRINDKRGMQRALRKIDTHVLAIALSDVPEDLRTAVFRNMTKTSGEILEKEIRIIKKTKNYNFRYADMNPRKAKEILSEILLKFVSECYTQETKYTGELPEIDLTTFETIIESFEKIGYFVYENGLLSIEGLMDKIGDPFFQKAVQLLLDGYDPLLFEGLLENYKRRMLQNCEVRMSMIIEGVKSLQMGHPPTSIREKLLSLSTE